MKHVHKLIKNRTDLFKYIASFSIVLLMLSGCGGVEPSAPKISKKETPSWYLNPPKDTSTKLYGIAIGKNRDDAIKHALTDMVAKLGINIESTYESSVKVQYSYASKKISNNVKSSIASISINNYEVIESERLSYKKFAVLLQSDKAKLAQSLKESIERKYTKLQTGLVAIKESNVLSRYVMTKKISEEANTLLSTILIIKELDPNYTGSLPLTFIESTHKKLLDITNNLNFIVKGDRNSRTFVTALENHLTHQGYHLTSGRSDNTVSISIKTSLNSTRVSSMKIVTYDVSIKAINKAEKIGGKHIIIKLRKSGNMNTLNKNAGMQFVKTLADQDIYTLLQIQ